jgi:Zn-dependent M28 family amino/carboxypeptidase
MERRQNEGIADWLHRIFDISGYRVERQGPFANIVALTPKVFPRMLLVGAHYDSVPTCPGADDNGSAVAAMLGCAAACSRWQIPLPIIFVAFNCEEDGLLGSRNFVDSYLPTAPFEIECAHILEMVGYAVTEPGSQTVPKGLPIKMSDTGDFLGLLANGISSKMMGLILRHVETYVPDLSVTGLNVKLGIEKYFPVLARSDHAPFWDRKIPAVMWTDTSEFRNHNYHRSTDTPDTLNYGFLQRVTRLLTACVVSQAEDLLEE